VSLGGRSRRDCLRRVEDVARWSDHAGCKGILVYTDNRLADPRLVSHVIGGTYYAVDRLELIPRLWRA
jgi:hypothetical protein